MGTTLSMLAQVMTTSQLIEDMTRFMVDLGEMISVQAMAMTSLMVAQAMTTSEGKPETM